MSSGRPATPPRALDATAHAKSPLTPEQVRRLEINRLKAKALREQREAAEAASQNGSLKRSDSNLAAGQKRNYATYTSGNPATSRDARASLKDRPLEAIQPARSFAKYVDYDFSKMTDTKGGFLAAEDDPHNKAMRHETKDANKPAQMTEGEWERQQMMRSLRNQKTGPFEPAVSAMVDKDTKRCKECRSLEIDWKFSECFDVAVCTNCKEKFPEKYSLLTKTEAKEDYLLTDPELKDEQLLPHMERPNPHKSNWHNMYLYLRCQVEDYAFSDKKWGSPEELDKEFERRTAETKRRKESKFKNKLAELKKRTRLEAYQRSRQGGGGNFGDDLGDGKHVHEFGQAVDNPDTGMPVKKCVECGFEVEELEL